MNNIKRNTLCIQTKGFIYECEMLYMVETQEKVRLQGIVTLAHSLQLTLPKSYNDYTTDFH